MPPLAFLEKSLKNIQVKLLLKKLIVCRMKENNQHSESENAPPRSFSDIHIAENQTFSTNGHQITMFLSVQQRLTSHRIAELFVAQIKCHKITSLRIFSSSTWKRCIRVSEGLDGAVLLNDCSNRLILVGPI